MAYTKIVWSTGDTITATLINQSEGQYDASKVDLDAHIADTTGAHTASAISIADAGLYFTATDVEGAMSEIGSSVNSGKTSVYDSIVAMGQTPADKQFSTLALKIRDISKDSTAVAGDIRSGDTAYAGGAKITGSLPVRATVAQTITPGTTNIIKTAGIYDGDITILGDTDLVAANILSGVNIFGVLGSAKPIKVVEVRQALNASLEIITGWEPKYVFGYQYTTFNHGTVSGYMGVFSKAADVEYDLFLRGALMMYRNEETSANNVTISNATWGTDRVTFTPYVGNSVIIDLRFFVVG
jgi:hypothetical protein